MKKPFGISKDPWRSVPEGRTKPADASSRASGEDSVLGVGEEPSDKFTDEQYTTIELKGYGGVTVEGTDQLPVAAAQLLAFCVDNLAMVEPTLLDYGILVTRLSGTSGLTTSFYIQRKDGWTLAVPDALNRDAGCLQLIQAMMKLYSQPLIKQKMTEYKLRPYKN